MLRGKSRAMTNANLYTFLEAHFPADRSATCLETPDGEVWTYADVEAESARCAHLLCDRGVTPGERVAVQVEKSPQALALYLACLRAGAIYLPLNPAYSGRELDHFLGDAEPRVVVAQPASVDGLAALCERHGVGELLSLGEHGEGTLTEAGRAMSERFDTVGAGRRRPRRAALHLGAPPASRRARCSPTPTCPRTPRRCMRPGDSARETCFCTCCPSFTPMGCSWRAIRRCSTARR